MKRNMLSAAFAASVVSFTLAACSSTPPAQDPVPQSPPPPSSSFVEKLDADGLFAFGKASIRDLSPDGRTALDAIAARLSGSAHRVEIVHVIGHSDRIGNAKGNMRLSNQRAEAVRGYLVEHGVPADRITAVGRGDVEPVVECRTERGQALIDCLAPNRRVEVRVRFAD
ncbi:OmpA family protein [Luteimonas sp. FCS-9]|uniref:OmpA family protein n=1 Tax=Luteimonas sp. FCS-9 TaxID=1547516 RepID=UPI00069C0F83|nr:OmpA family protein [Luteimonas sp. FCS-9]